MALFFKGKEPNQKNHPMQNKDLSHVQFLLVCVFCDRCGLINSTISFDQRAGGKKKLKLMTPHSVGSSLGPLQQHSQVHSHLARHGAVYCGSAHTSREQTELPQDTVKKKKKKASIFHQTTLSFWSRSKPRLLQSYR